MKEHPSKEASELVNEWDVENYGGSYLFDDERLNLIHRIDALLAEERRKRERAEKERDAFKSTLAMFRGMVAEVKELCECEVASEQLGGNIVKENYWMGQLSLATELNSLLKEETQPC